ncbi:UNKNOWN [Stylonychia lemnae]|uniref:Uncharacterized protein n=1 Tax=Stylonychia lemnae TaxID=5949 RepID=A0A078AYA9_STYLE|nr:UNKNOWN [Stylonychia lemnae]|eukprot:CDW87385.1 UNKNOWN [Stylonychia lemnae]
MQQMQQLRMIQQDKERELVQKEKQIKWADSLENQIKIKKDIGGLEYMQGINQRLDIDEAQKLGDQQELVELDLTARLKQSISKENYSQNQHHHYRDQQLRQQLLQEEQQHLQNVDKALRKDQQFKEQEQFKYQQSVKELVEMKKVEKDKERDRSRREKEEYAQSCIENQKVHSKQQQQYMEYFQLQDMNQRQRQQQYQSTVLIPELTKLDQISQKEQKDQYMYQRKLDEKEMEKYNRRLSNQVSTTNTNKDLLSRKSNDHFLNQLTKQKELQDRLINERNQHIESALSIEQNKKLQNFYKLTLDQQKRMKDSAVEEYGQMTHQEKKFNKYDLEGYKNWDATLPPNTYRDGMVNMSNGLVPGLIHNNTIGSVPVKTQRNYDSALNQMTSKDQQFFTQRNLSNRNSYDRLPSRSSLGESPNGNMNQQRQHQQSRHQSKESQNRYSPSLLNQGAGAYLQAQQQIQQPPLKGQLLQGNLYGSSSVGTLISPKKELISITEYNTIVNPIANKEKNPIIQRMKLQHYMKNSYR